MSDVITRSDTITVVKTKLPDMWKVIIHNDNSTPMEFVMQILITIFNKSAMEAYELMMRIHMGEKGCAGIYTKEIADTKKAQTDEATTSFRYELRTSVEKV